MKTWSAKPTKNRKSLDVFSNLVDLKEKSVIEKKITEIELPDIPRNIASAEKPNKKDIVKYRKSRLAIQCLMKVSLIFQTTHDGIA